MAKSSRRGYRHNHRRNPSFSKGILPMIVSAAVGGFVTRSVPQALLGASNTGVMGYAANAGVALAGGWALGKFVSKDVGLGFVIGGGAGIVLRMYQDYTSGASSTGVSDHTMGFYATQAFPTPYATAPGSPFANPFAAAYPSAMPALPPSSNPAAAAAVQTAIPKTPYSQRLRGRFAAN
ncbi:MAG TPA: hypothetical protein VG345_16635 [Bryobacteraceae bacterium]|nr:hypothetical protein [Bryobacteraceae bacterium]